MAKEEGNFEKKSVDKILKYFKGQKKTIPEDFFMYELGHNEDGTRQKYYPLTFYRNAKIDLTKPQLLKNAINAEGYDVDIDKKNIKINLDGIDRDRTIYAYMKAIVELYSNFGWTKFIVFIRHESDINRIFDVLESTKLSDKYYEIAISNSKHPAYNKPTSIPHLVSGSQSFLVRNIIRKYCLLDLRNIKNMNWGMDDDRALFFNKINSFMSTPCLSVMIINYSRIIGPNDNLRLNQLSRYKYSTKHISLNNIDYLFKSRPIVIADDSSEDFVNLAKTKGALFTIKARKGSFHLPTSLYY